MNASNADRSTFKNLESGVTIIGAGPAGIMASLWLTKSGVPHLLLDAQEFPRVKACADVVTGVTIRCLNEIDPVIIPDMLEKGLLNPIARTEIITPRNRALKIRFRTLNGHDLPSCYSIKRELFDAYLMDLVKGTGYATVVSGCYVRDVKYDKVQYTLHSKQGHTIQSKLVIAATGSNSGISEKLGSVVKEDRHFALGIRAYFKDVRCDNDVTELFLDKSVFPGGLYITPLPGGEFNVNMVVKKDVAHKRKLDLKQQFDQLIGSHPLLKEKFRFAEQLSEFKGSGLFLGTKRRTISGDGYMLAGDAAGLIDLLSANGIPQAMVSGRYAAEKAVQCLAANNFTAAFMKEYDRKLNLRIKSYLQLSRLVNPIISYSFFRHIGFFLIHIMAGSRSGNSPLAELIYAKKPLYLFVNPLFYSRLVLSLIRQGKRGDPPSLRMNSINPHERLGASAD